MTSRWVDEEAAAIADDVGLCAYASRLLGADPTLVLAGGGNSSVKTTEADVFGDPVEVLHVKGSGWDMAALQPGGLAPLRLATVARLAELPELSDAADGGRAEGRVDRPQRPRRRPSSRSCTPTSRSASSCTPTPTPCSRSPTPPTARPTSRRPTATTWWSCPYVMPGFVLAKACAEAFPAQRHDGTIGMVLLNHGLFTFADDARTAYENHVALVERALARLAAAERGDPSPGLGGDEALDADAEALDVGAFGAGDASAFGSGSGAAVVGAEDSTASTWTTPARSARSPGCAATSRGWPARRWCSAPPRARMRPASCGDPTSPP